jgi:rubrerythrin
VAAQQLTGNGFTQVINLSGGIKAWTGQRAIDDEEHGLELFMNLSDPIEVLSMAYSLEEGLQDFYKTMAPCAKSRKTADIFNQLASIEDLHKDRLFAEYTRITGLDDREEFQADLQELMLEGGLTTEEYLQRFGTDLENLDEIIAMAMSIEGQALDLYSRAAQRTPDGDNQKILEKIAVEEKAHLERLGELMDSILGESNG